MRHKRRVIEVKYQSPVATIQPHRDTFDLKWNVPLNLSSSSICRGSISHNMMAVWRWRWFWRQQKPSWRLEMKNRRTKPRLDSKSSSAYGRRPAPTSSTATGAASCIITSIQIISGIRRPKSSWFYRAAQRRTKLHDFYWRLIGQTGANRVEWLINSRAARLEISCDESRMITALTCSCSSTKYFSHSTFHSDHRTQVSVWCYC